jgi:hypothetical protein
VEQLIQRQEVEQEQELTFQPEVVLLVDQESQEDLVEVVVIKVELVKLQDQVMLEVLTHQKETMVEEQQSVLLQPEVVVEVVLALSDLMEQQTMVEQVDQEQMLVVVFQEHQIQEYTQAVVAVQVFVDQIHLVRQEVVDLVVEVVVMLEQLELQTLAVAVVLEGCKVQQEHTLLEQQVVQE